jgi:hypothetical protein
MNGYARAFRITVRIGVLVNLALCGAALFAPDWFLSTAGFDPAYPNLWPRFAALLLILLSMAYLPGARDLDRYRANAVLSVLARVSGVIFFTAAVQLLGFSSRFYLFALLDLAFAVPGGIFLVLAVRRGQREARPFEPLPTETSHAADQARVAQTL